MWFLSAISWIKSNWKLVAIAAILALSFGSGWWIRGYIAEAAQNKAIADAVAQTKVEEKATYEQARKVEEARRKSREAARRDAIRLDADTQYPECLDAPVIPIEWLRISWEAIADRTSQP